MSAPENKKTNWIIAAILMGAVLLVYWPARTFDFINFDDPHYVSKNGWVQAGVTAESVEWAFTQAHSSNWHPITWVSHMLDCQLFGLDAGKHHQTNLIFHAVNSALLFAMLYGLTGARWRSATVAALFALHPLHVESVAWIAERKDVLSAFFGILTLMAYARYARGSGLKSKAWYGATLILFALGLMSKPMLVTWPFVMLLLDFWPLNRINLEAKVFSLKFWKVNQNRIWEKLPFFVLVLASSVITYLVQSQSGAVASLERVSVEMRVMNAIIAYVAYLLKMFWPTNLAVIYLPPEKWDAELVLAALAVLIGVTVGVIRAGFKHRYLPIGWFWYVGTLVPVIGLVQVGNQSMADRYTYLPLIGIFVMLAWGLWEMIAKWQHARLIATVLGIGVSVAGAGLTRNQVWHWQNSETLFTHCLRVTKENYVIHNHLGTALLLEGRIADAEPHYQEALRIRPGYSEALNNMGVLLTQRGQITEAMLYLQEAVRISPKFADTYGKLAIALTASGKTQDAINYYRKAIALNPKLVEALNNLAWLLATHPDETLRDGPEAVRLAEQAGEIVGSRETIYIGTLGAAYAEAGRFPEAVATAQRARAAAQQRGETDLATKNAELEELFRAEKPYREKPLTIAQP